ncbi:MAG: protease HtpX [Myxococcota bacterium]
MKRIFLFLLTNLAILAVLGTVFQLLGLEGVLDEQGVDLDLGNLFVYALVIGMTGSAVSLALSKWVAKRMTGARVIVQPRGEAESWLVQRVHQHAEAAGISAPQVAIFDSPDPNAFATGARRNNALIAVSSGLLQRMGRDEVDAVLGHEVSHIANGDMITLALIQGVVNTFVVFFSRIIGHYVDRVVFRTERGHGIAYFVTSIFAQIVLGILASAIALWFSRQREFRADAGGARLAGTGKMIAALERLKSGAEPLPEQLAAFGISGGRRAGLRRFFSTHPSLDERIARLKQPG